MLEALLDRFRQHDRLALSRLLSLLARGEHVAEVLAALGPPQGRARVVAVTGSAGVGKSTLVGRLVAAARKHGQSVAVLACDPQSPLTGGALLGDRFRMPDRADDDGVFIRSLAAASGRGAVAENLAAMVRVLEAFGFDVVLIETVGAGQGDVAVRELADVVGLLLQPETGDDLQWEKAGVLEVADVIVVHKADLPAAGYVEARVRAMLALSGREPPPVLRVSARTGAGVEDLWAAIAACPPRRSAADTGASDLLRLTQGTLRARFAAAQAAGDPGLRELVAEWQQGKLAGEQAAAAFWELLAVGYGARLAARRETDGPGE
jgi:LAO/AO transport system ATPase